MALQELDFNIKFIAGSENSVADALSRLCINNKIGTAKNIVSAIIDSKPLTADHYASIAQCHNSMVGHSGVDKTVKRLKLLKLKWPDMRTDVWTFIQNCPCCQKMSQIRPPINALKYTTSTYRAMECLNIDFVGPYPDKGYLLVIIDTFTRYVNIYPVPEATAKSAVSGLIKHFGLYGSPKYIRSDNGSHFVNEVIRQFLLIVGTTHDKTMAYSSEENSIVERCNKEVNRYIRAFTFDTSTQDNYQEHIPFIMRILNTNVNERTKVAPAQLMYGNAINLDRGILIPFDETPLTPNSLTKSTSDMLSQQDNLMRIATDNLLLADNQHNSQVSNNLTEYQIDSFVLALPRAQPLTRLHTLWSGPYRVVSREGSKYKVLDLITNKYKMYHVTQLKAFKYDPLRTDPTDVARRDHLEYFVERIISFTGDIRKVSTLMFLVKWEGSTETTHEPWKNLMNNECLHHFLIKHNLKNLIPRKFQLNYTNSNTNEDIEMTVESQHISQREDGAM